MKGRENNRHRLFLVSSILRDRVFSSIYWKGECFALDSETILDKAVLISYIGTTYGGERKATPFLCLLVKLLQINPSIEIVLEYINNPRFKYLTALGILYLRLTAPSIVIYNSIEHLYQDFRRIKLRELDGSFRIIHIDELVETCLCERRFLDLDFPYIQKRAILVKQGLLKYPRKSKLEYNPSNSCSPSPKSPVQIETRKRARSLSRSPVEQENELERLQSHQIIPKYSPGHDVDLSVDQWNVYRKKLGLKPLK
ncbi:putative pre-mRNA-splicing factor 38A [Cryptosporidium felis]|nr:putative pre-mRNA-splicing factor 38A [Cryptosporidium felis]